MTNDQNVLKMMRADIQRFLLEVSMRLAEVTDPRALAQVERVMDALSDAKIGTELTIKELERP